MNVLCCLCEIDGAREWISFGDLLRWFWEVNIGLERLVCLSVAVPVRVRVRAVM